jgi:hypothetical protein
MKLITSMLIAVLISSQGKSQGKSYGCKVDNNYCMSQECLIEENFQYSILDLRGETDLIMPSCLSGNKYLEYLSLIECDLDSMPPIVFSLSNLASLLVGNNKISFIPCDFCKLKDLQVVNFFNNPIKELPSCMGQMECLQTVMISDTEITHLPQVLYEIPNLEFVAFGSDFKMPVEEIIKFQEARPNVECTFW